MNGRKKVKKNVLFFQNACAHALAAVAVVLLLHIAAFILAGYVRTCKVTSSYYR